MPLPYAAPDIVAAHELMLSDPVLVVGLAHEIPTGGNIQVDWNSGTCDDGTCWRAYADLDGSLYALRMRKWIGL